ncbi:hypothetical protein Mapa_006136 [Marchantia paleacea]|nr:hypothetical protein Mapa_006136 [Marchantia paleacea]
MMSSRSAASALRSEAFFALSIFTQNHQIFSKRISIEIINTFFSTDHHFEQFSLCIKIIWDITRLYFECDDQNNKLKAF